MPEIHRVNLGVLLHDNVVDEKHSNLNSINTITSRYSEIYNHNLKISADVRELRNLLVQMENLEEVKIKVEPKELDDDLSPLELTTFICQPDLDIKQDFESDKMLQRINENVRKIRTTTSDHLQTKLVTEPIEESREGQTDTPPLSPNSTIEDDLKCASVLTEIPMTDTEKQNRKCPKAVAVMIKSPLLNALYKCPKYDCTFATTFPMAFQKHFAAHSFLMDTLVLCLYCDYKVSCSSYVIHLEVRHGHCLFGCGDCFYQTTNSYFITMHRELAHPNTKFNILQLKGVTLNRSRPDITSHNLSELVPPYNCRDDGFLSCPFKTLYFDEYLKHVEAIHQVDGLGSFSSEHELQRVAVMEGWLAKEVGPFQCGYCKKATVTHQEMGRHQAVLHAQEQCLFYYRKFVLNDTVIIPEQVNLDDPSFINHVIHLPEQIHLCDFKLTDGLISSTSAKLTNGESEVSLPHLLLPTKDIDTDSNQSNVSIDEPETFNVLVKDEPCLLDKWDSMCLSEQPKDDGAHNDTTIAVCKLQCKWKGCYQTYDSQTALEKHIEKNHIWLQRGKIFTCFWINCPRKLKPYARKHTLLVHTRIHSGEKPYKCTFQGCNKAFSHLASVKFHQGSHTRKRIYLCQFSNCIKSFRTCYDRNNHHRIHYNPFVCQVVGCSKEYAHQRCLWKHMKKHSVDEQLEAKQKSEEKQKQGYLVQKKSSSNSVENKHQRTHSDMLQCEWEGCYQIYDTQMALGNHIEKNHVQLQRDEEFTCFWINCPKRSKPFNTKHSLSMHMKLHSGEKTHKCPFQGCSKAFSLKENLKVHERIHTGQKPFLCQFSNCFKSFTTSSNRIKHQRTHCDTIPYASQITGCSEKYTNPDSLKKHVKSQMVNEQFKVRSVKAKQKESNFVLEKSSNCSNGAKHQSVHYDTMIPKEVNLEDPSFINHIIHPPDQIHQRDFKPMDSLLSSPSAMLTNGKSKVSLHLLTPSKNTETDLDQSSVSLEEPEAFSRVMNDKMCLLEEPNSLHLDEQSKDGSAHSDATATACKLQCKWRDCYQTYDSQKAMVKHIERSHVKLQSGKKFTCSWDNCPKKLKPYTSKRSLLIHMRIHSGERPYKCAFQGCSEEFLDKGSLRIHQRRHTGERPYLCQFPNCFKTFLTSSSRSFHQKRTHCNFESFACPVTGCSRKYTTIYILRKHMKSHTVDQQHEAKWKSVENKQKEGDVLKKSSNSLDGNVKSFSSVY